MVKNSLNIATDKEKDGNPLFSESAVKKGTMSMPVLEAERMVEEIFVEEELMMKDETERMLAELEQLDLPADDGIPMESNWHRIEMNLLIDSVHALWRDRTDFFSGGNMFIYFSLKQVRHKDYRGPDFFVVKNVDGTRDRESWVVWEEGGRYPNVIVELASHSTIKIDMDTKKELYEQVFRTPEYFCYDPATKRLHGWRLEHGVYIDLPLNEDERLWSEELQLWLGQWNGELLHTQATWLRLFTPEGELVPTIGEAERERAETERERACAAEEQLAAEREKAERLAAKLRELGVDVD